MSSNRRAKAKCADCGDEYAGAAWEVEEWADEHEFDYSHEVKIREGFRGR